MSRKNPYKKAFVSSTFADLKDHRAHVIEQLRNAGFFVDPMENWTADTDEPKQFSQDRMEGCDLCVLLVAFRRGCIPEGETRSITQLEYEAAVKMGIDIWTFMLDDDALWRAKFDEREKDDELVTWRFNLRKRHGSEFFTHDPHSIDLTGALGRWFGPVKSADMRVIRGGSWNYEQGFQRSSYRMIKNSPSHRSSGLGFRLAQGTR
jgi:hypothetical protein